MPSEAILKLTNSDQTLIKAVAAHPNESIAKLASALYKHGYDGSSKDAKKMLRRARNREDYTSEDLAWAEKCGKFPYKPSDLFLMVSGTTAFSL